MIDDVRAGWHRLAWAVCFSAGLHLFVLAFAFQRASIVAPKSDNLLRALMVQQLNHSQVQPAPNQQTPKESGEATNPPSLTANASLVPSVTKPGVNSEKRPLPATEEKVVAPQSIPASNPQPTPKELPPAPEYLNVLGLDPPPKPLHEINPDYPASAGLREGTVVLRLLINEFGDVDNVAVVRSYPKDMFDLSAIEAFGRAKFSPGKLFGIPVKSQMTIEVAFTPINRGSNVSGKGY